MLPGVDRRQRQRWISDRRWTSHHEWTSHSRVALDAGVSAEAIAEIAAGGQPRFAEEREQMAYEIASALLAGGQIPQPLYEPGTACLGEQGMVELVATVGYYCLVSLTLNAFEIGLPEGFAPELGEPASGPAGR